MNTTQPQNTTNRPPTSPPTTARRGSALLLAVGVLLLVFLAGVAFVSSSQSARIAGSAASRASSNDAAIQATVNYIGQVIAQDWTDYTTGVAGSEYHDYPHPNIDPWLASTEPEDIARFTANQRIFMDTWGFASDTTLQTAGDGDPNINANNWDAWRNISRLPNSAGTSLQFIDLNDFLPIGEATGNNIYTTGAWNPALDTQTLTYHPVDDSIYGTSDAMNQGGDPFNLNTAADADGDGYIDSRWVELPINAPGGLRWAAAVRIIDESALANVNTATEIEPIILQPRDSMVLGTTPADLDLQRLLARTDFTTTGNNADWSDVRPLWFSQGQSYDGFVASDIYQQVGTTGGQRGDSPYYGVASLAAPPVTSSQVPREALYKALGYPETIAGNPPSTMPSGAYPYNRTDREARYHLFGRNLDQPSLARYSTTNQGIYTAPWNENNFILAERPYIPFGTETLAELRTRFGLNSPGWSALEYSLYNAFEATDGNGFSVLRSNRIETPGYASRRQMRQGIRHLITTYSGARQLRPEIDPGNAGPTFTDELSSAKLNLNQLYIEDTAGTSPSPEAQAFLDRAEEAGLTSAERHALLANLMAYRIPGVYNDVPLNRGVDQADTRTNTLSDFQIVDGATTYTGLEAQPFFREAVAIIELRDADPGDALPPAGLAAMVENTTSLLIEIANPWDSPTTTGYDADINLDDYELLVRVGATEYNVALTGTLAPGEALVIHSDNVLALGGPQLFKQGTGAPIAGTSVRFEPAGTLSAASTTPEDLNNRFTRGASIEFELRYVAGTADILVDRFREGGGFSINDGDYTVPSLVNNHQIILSKSLRRDDNKPTANSMPLFVLEDQARNSDTLQHLDDNPSPVLIWEIDENLGPTNGPAIYTLTEPFQLHLGKARNPATANDTTAPTLDSVAELGLLLTVAHEAGGAAGDIPISENLAAAITAANDRYFAKLEWTNVPAGSNDLPDPVNLMDQFTTVQAADSGLTGTATPALNPGMAFGVVNINTAPQRVLEALPFALGGRVFNNHPMIAGTTGAQRAKGVLDYRDLPDTFDAIDFGTPGAANRTVSGVTGVRGEPGFASIGELAMVRSAANTQEAFDRLANDAANASVTDGDFTDDNVTDDLEEELLPLIRTAALTSVRSDIFTAYVLLQGRRPNPDNPTTYDKVVERRFIVTYDRSNVNAPGDQPRVLMFIEDR